METVALEAPRTATQPAGEVARAGALAGLLASARRPSPQRAAPPSAGSRPREA